MIRLTKKKIVFVGVLLLFFFSILFVSFSPICLRVIKNKEDLYGNYINSYSFAQEQLKLNEDGTFIQTIVFQETSESKEVRGQWNYRQKNGYIVFDHNYMNMLDGFGKFNPDYMVPKDGVTLLPVRKWFGQTLIEIYEGKSYKKIQGKIKGKNKGGKIKGSGAF